MGTTIHLMIAPGGTCFGAMALIVAPLLMVALMQKNVGGGATRPLTGLKGNSEPLAQAQAEFDQPRGWEGLKVPCSFRASGHCSPRGGTGQYMILSQRTQ